MTRRASSTESPWQLIAAMFSDSADVDRANVDIPHSEVTFARSGFPVLLKYVAESLDAFACVLWEEAPMPPGADGDAPLYFTLGAWYKEGNGYATHNVSADDTQTGRIIAERQPDIVSDLLETDQKAMTPHMRASELDQMLAVPITYVGDTRGSVNVYRKKGAPEFAEQDKEWLIEMAQAIPLLIRRDRERTDLSVLQRVETILEQAESLLARRKMGAAHEEETTPSTDVTPCLREICEAIATALNCLEVSIILEDTFENPGEYKLWATTWEARWQFKHHYKKDTMDCVGYCLTKQEPVRVFNDLDLAAERADRIYPGLRWGDMVDLEHHVRQAKKIEPKAEMPSISTMLIPIVFGNDTLGLIRCTAVRIEPNYYGPYYFAKRDLDFLGLVAGQLSRYWRNWIDRMVVQRENASWRAFSEGIGKLNAYVVDQIHASNPSTNTIYAQALQLISDNVPGADILDTRLKSEDGESLYFHTTLGAAWSEGTPEDIRRRREKRFRFEAEPKSAGVRAYCSGETVASEHVDGESGFDLTFPNTRWIVIAPIRLATTTVGIIDVRGTTRVGLATYTRTLTELLARQLALYHLLFENFRTLKQSQVDYRELAERQQEFFRDLAHQLRTPVLNALQQAMRAVQQHPRNDIRSLRMLRGQVRRCSNVVNAIQLLYNLLSDRPIQIQATTPDLEALRLLLINLAEDTELMAEPAKRISFEVERRWLWDDEADAAKSLKLLHLDFSLFQQALGNLLDNAAKYSYRNTTVSIEARRTKTGNFAFAVISRGLRLSREECRLCREREWRSAEAQLVQGAGTGLGLWIVDHIMRAHGGSLEIQPTDSESITRFTLLFPPTGER